MKEDRVEGVGCVFVKNCSIYNEYEYQCFSDLMEMQHIMCIVLRGGGGGGGGESPTSSSTPDLPDALKLEIILGSSDQLCVQYTVNT